jgi:purine-binding chemotaxis protein CheW
MVELEKQKSYLTFELGKETFASNVSKVLNILEVPHITEVPRTPSYMVGVMNLGGAALPVVDTRKKFGMKPIDVTTNTCVIVLEVESDEQSIKIGALVDAVDKVLEIEANEIEPSPSIGKKYNTEFILGMLKKDESFIMILDMDKVFTSDEIISLQNANQPTEVES